MLYGEGMKTRFAACAALVLGPVLAGTADAQSLRLVENLLVFNASRDGSVLVGSEANGYATSWTQSAGFTLVRGSNGQAISGYASVISADGAVVGGETWNTQGRGSLFRWQGPGTYENLGNAGALEIRPLGITDNGRTMVGNYRVSGGDGAFRWTPETGIRALPLGQDGEAVAITSDGRTYAGSIFSGGRSYAIVATEGQSVLNLGGGELGSNAYNMTSDGRAVVGFWGTIGEGGWTTATACVWRDGVVEMLGRLSGYNDSIAHSISDNGSIITGVCSTIRGPVGEDDFVWTASTGMIGFTAYAHLLGYVTPADYTYSDVAVTRDGTMMYGRYNRWEGGQFVGHGAFMMAVPVPATTSMLLFGLLGLHRRVARPPCGL
jgi:uncharacterized membrane protein